MKRPMSGFWHLQVSPEVSDGGLEVDGKTCRYEELLSVGHLQNVENFYFRIERQTEGAHRWGGKGA